MAEKIKLEKTDWQDCKNAAINQLKILFAQRLIYELQLEVAERELKKFPADEPKKVETDVPTGAA